MASSPRPLPLADAETRLRALYGDGVLSVEDQFGHLVVSVIPGRYHEVAETLRDDPAFACDYYDFGGAVDFGEGGIEVVAHLYSTRHNHNLRLKVRCDGGDPRCASLADLWGGANWHEREAAEMFGIVFEGHPQPVRLLLSEEFEGHPLRKDFPLMTREAKPWPGAAEGEEEEGEE